MTCLVGLWCFGYVQSRDTSVQEGQNYDFSVVSIVKNSTNAKMNEKRLDLQLQTLDYLYSNINE